MLVNTLYPLWRKRKIRGAQFPLLPRITHTAPLFAHSVFRIFKSYFMVYNSHHCRRRHHRHPIIVIKSLNFFFLHYEQFCLLHLKVRRNPNISVKLIRHCNRIERMKFVTNNYFFNFSVFVMFVKGAFIQCHILSSP